MVFLFFSSCLSLPPLSSLLSSPLLSSFQLSSSLPILPSMSLFSSSRTHNSHFPHSFAFSSSSSSILFTTHNLTNSLLYYLVFSSSSSSCRSRTNYPLFLLMILLLFLLLSSGRPEHLRSLFEQVASLDHMLTSLESQIEVLTSVQTTVPKDLTGE